MASKAEYKRAARLRKRVTDGGKPLFAEELEWLARYDAAKHKTAEDESIETLEPENPPTGPAMPGDPDSAPLPSGSGSGGPSDPLPQEVPIAPPPASPPPPPPPKARALPAPPLPTPPRAARDDHKDEGSSKGWQGNYKNGQTSGREATCVYLGSLWHGALKQMEASMLEAGIKPVIDVDKLAGPIVLALDDLLPPDVVLTPTIVAVGGSTALSVQRFMRRKEIADHEKQKEFVKNVRQARDANVAKPEQVKPEPAPPAPPPAEPIAPVAPPAPPVPVEAAPVTNGVKPSPATEAEKHAAYEELFGVSS